MRCHPYSPRTGITASLIAAAFAFPATAHADVDPSEYGLKHAIRVSVGAYDASSNSNSFTPTSLDSNSADAKGFVAKLDFLFFRPTRHEANIGILFLNPPSEAREDGLIVVSPEYRWRFGDRGRFYYGVNAGLGFNLGGNSDIYFVAGSALGYEIGGRAALEYRYYRDENDTGISAFMIGYRL